MIIRNNFNNKSVNYIDEERKNIRQNVDNLDKRFKNKEVSLESLKRIANTFAKRQNDLNKKSNNH